MAAPAPIMLVLARLRTVTLGRNVPIDCGSCTLVNSFFRADTVIRSLVASRTIGSRSASGLRIAGSLAIGMIISTNCDWTVRLERNVYHNVFFLLAFSMFFVLLRH